MSKSHNNNLNFYSKLSIEEKFAINLVAANIIYFILSIFKVDLLQFIISKVFLLVIITIAKNSLFGKVEQSW